VNPVIPLIRVLNRGAVLPLFLLLPMLFLAGAAHSADEGGQPTPLDVLEYWLGPSTAEVRTPTIWRVNTGIEYSRYTIGPGQTADVWMPFYALALTHDAWTLGLSGSYQSFTAPVPEIGIPGSTTKQTIAGAGDTVASLRYDIPASLTPGWYTSVIARVKIPTASESEGLGTGKVDGTLGFDVIRPIGRWSLFGYGAHTWRGDSPRLIKDRTWNASAGADYRVAARWNAGASVDWRQLGFSGDTTSVYTYARYRITNRLSVTGYSVAGLDRNSPDYSVGVQFSLFGVW